MGAMIKDSTTLDIVVQLNRRFDAEALAEMVELQREFGVFSRAHGLQQSFALLGIVPSDWSERRRWYKFLDFLKTYPSDIASVNGHDRVIQAFKDDLECERPLPVSIVCHSAAEDPRVTVTQGRPIIFSLDTHVIISIPTTPGREARKQAAETARTRRVEKRKK
ncbi:conserved hypothetical protein [Bradyrhizobium oligotrophicum S58]|uniref:Uncharacterized protein n=1 Tax=Bradyrhizobium oligotrophicum S58 TaxID=1245469 RepID=M4ZEH1_9BRAD|nr:hypothetical protein [Bradyrhizobium oligotrophicum]BAM92247.1 conserved hypothetical protein [Bradyrhizobium oligotrophicum S58]